MSEIKQCSLCLNEVVYLPIPEFYKTEAAKHGYQHFGRGEMISIDEYCCPICKASDRERIFAYWISEALERKHLSSKSKVIHFSPEQPLSKWIVKKEFFEIYKTADLNMNGVDYKNCDITDLPFENNSFDFFICSHVLEHVNDDRKAIRELYRILSKIGFGIIVAPICLDINITDEDPNEKIESERWRRFGQNDHVRLYSHNDYVSRIEGEGFTLKQLDIQHFGEEVYSTLGLTKSSILYIAYRNKEN